MSSPRKTVQRTPQNLPWGACRGRSATLPAAQHRLPAEADPSSFGVQRQLEADFRSDLHNVACFQRRRVVLVSQRDVGFGGIRLEPSVPCSAAQDALNTFIQDHTGSPPILFVPHRSWQILKFHLKALPLPLLSPRCTMCHCPHVDKLENFLHPPQALSSRGLTPKYKVPIPKGAAESSGLFPVMDLLPLEGSLYKKRWLLY